MEKKNTAPLFIDARDGDDKAVWRAVQTAWRGRRRQEKEARAAREGEKGNEGRLGTDEQTFRNCTNSDLRFRRERETRGTAKPHSNHSLLTRVLLCREVMVY